MGQRAHGLGQSGAADARESVATERRPGSGRRDLAEGITLGRAGLPGRVARALELPDCNHRVPALPTPMRESRALAWRDDNENNAQRGGSR